MKEKPQAYFIVGVNGSGKSTIRDDLILPKDIVIIDPDKIAKENNLSEIQAGKFAINLFEQSLKARKSFLLESTLSGKSIITRMQKAKEQGYSVKTNFVGLKNVSLNIARVNDRVKNGGHSIPKEVIERRHADTYSNLYKLPGISDHLKIYDNSNKNNPFQKKAEFIRGKIRFIDFDLEKASKSANLTKDIKENQLLEFLYKTVLSNKNSSLIT